jgi:hypothetical protein
MYTRAVADVALWKRLASVYARTKTVVDGGAGVHAVTAVTSGPPAVLTVPTHGYSDGNAVTVTGIRGAVELNGSWTVEVVDASRIRLAFSPSSSSYTGGGFVVRSPVSDFDDAFAKALSFMKVEMSDPLSPGDAEFAVLDQKGFVEAVDIAEAESYDGLSSSLTAGAGVVTDQRWPDYSYRVDPQAVLFVQQQAKGKMDTVRRVYGYGASTLRYGAINLGFQAGSTKPGTEF